MIETLELIWQYLTHPMVILIWMHFVADFMFQTDKVANNKSKSNKTLLWHVSLYSIPFFWFGWVFAITNAFAHFLTDFVTARATSWLYQNDHRHWFFVVIGFDQAIHMTTLFVTYAILVGF